MNTRAGSGCLRDGGGRGDGDPLAARVQPGVLHPVPARVGRVWARKGTRRTLNLWSCPSRPQRHEQRPRAGPGARQPHALGRGGLPGPPLPAAERLREHRRARRPAQGALCQGGKWRVSVGPGTARLRWGAPGSPGLSSKLATSALGPPFPRLLALPESERPT